jgi:hypothetical protein
VVVLVVVFDPPGAVAGIESSLLEAVMSITGSITGSATAFPSAYIVRMSKERSIQNVRKQAKSDEMMPSMSALGALLDITNL